MSISDNVYGMIDRLADNGYATRMSAGRPAIGKFTAVRLSSEVLARIDALVPSGQRAAFVRAAVETELARREAASASAGLRDPAALYAVLSAKARTRP